MSRANAIANAFLQFRARQETSAQQVLVRSLEQELGQATQTEQNLSSQISRVQAEPSSPSRQTKLKSLQNEHKQALINLGVLQQTVAGAQAGNSTLSAVTASVVLDPASPLAHSKLKGRLIYAVYGLIVGLLLGIGIVVVRAVVSDKLRRRDDIARALGAPVKLSVGAVRLSRRFPPGRRGLEAADAVEIRGSSPISAMRCRPRKSAPPSPSYRSTTRTSRRCLWCRWPFSMRRRAARLSWPISSLALRRRRSWTTRVPGVRMVNAEAGAPDAGRPRPR